VAVKNEEAAFTPGGRYFVDRMGEVVLPGPFKEAEGFHEGLATVQEGELWGFIDTTGSMVIPAQFESAKRFSKGWAPVAIQPKDRGPLLWGVIDKTGKYVLEPRFTSIYRFERGIASAREVVDGQHEEPATCKPLRKKKPKKKKNRSASRGTACRAHPLHPMFHRPRAPSNRGWSR
jgi:hypothetical protein